ncbi:MAG: TonB-dependent receptor [Bacteroidota bacterium]
MNGRGSLWKIFGLLVVLFALGLAAPVSAQPTRTPITTTVRGFVTDAESGQALPGATVGLFSLAAPDATPAQTVTDNDGIFLLGGRFSGRYTLQVSYVGYETAIDTLLLGSRDVVTLAVQLAPGQTLGEVQVEAEGGAAQVEAGRQSIRPQDLARIPTPDLSGDLASYLQALPSVVAVGDRGGGLYVRGGTPPQNLVLMDGAVVFQPFHIVGFFSAFPEDLVANTEFYAGGFGARYTGRLSSVLDVTMRDGNLNRVAAAGSVSPFLASVQAEGPLVPGRVSVIGSARASLIEQVGPALGQDLPLRFGDVFAKVTRADPQSGRCSLSGLYTFDEGAIDPQATDVRRDVFRWSNAAMSGRCVLLPRSVPFEFETQLGLSNVRNSVGDPDRPQRSSSATVVNAEAHLARVQPRLRLGGGLFTRLDFLNYELGGQFVGFRANEELLLASGGYIEAIWDPGYGLELHPGLSVTTYYGDYAFSLEPRFRFAWQPWGTDGPTQLNGAIGLYRQTVNGVSDERDAGSVFLAWLPNPVGDGQAEALHAMVGVQQKIGPFTLAVEGYAKRLDDLAVPIWSAIARFTTELTPADGSVYGLDARLEWQRGPFYTFVGYGLSQTEYTIFQAPLTGGPEGFQTYNPPHDRRHQLNALASFELSDFEASVRWQYGSGLPFTRPFGFDSFVPFFPLPDVTETFGIPRVLYREPFNGRLPAYHRLDVSVSRTFEVGPGDLSVQVGAINVYDRANLFYFDIFTVRRVDQLPLLPFLGLKYELGA